MIVAFQYLLYSILLKSIREPSMLEKLETSLSLHVSLNPFSTLIFYTKE